MKVPGTHAYVSPEVFQYGKDRLTAKSDIWALGCIGYELFTGRQIFENEEMHEAFVRNSQIDPSHIKQVVLMEEREPQIHQIISACLVVDPDKRANVWTLLGLIGPSRESFR